MAKRQARYCFIYGFATTLIAAAPEFRRTPQAGSQSNQYFGRGLELDAGTDFSVDFWGIPLNTPSHVRGPGYLDTNIVIPELVEGFQYTKGPYQAEQGPFAVAGSASMSMASDLDRPFLSVTYGGARTDRYARLLWVERLLEPRVTYALDFTRNDRTWDDIIGSARFNGAFRKDGEGAHGRWSFTALGTEDKSDGGAATPARPFPEAVSTTLSDAKAGDGVWLQRLLLGWRLQRDDAQGGSTKIRLYGGAHHERRWNNWTYFLRDKVNGDQLEQVDRRMFLGADCARTWTRREGAVEWVHTLGVQTRADRLTAVEVAPTADRQRLVPSSSFLPLSARADLLHGALYGQSSVLWAQGWEAFLGARLDAQVNHASDVTGGWTAQNRSQVLGSPKAGLSYSPVIGTKFALQAGQGFRLGDAFRETQPMVRARSAEISAQTRPLAPWTTCVTVWRLDLESESLFDPSLNAYTGRGPALHKGIEFFNELKRGPWRWDLTWGWNRASFKDQPEGQERVPGFVPQTGSLGMGWKDRGLSVDMRVRRTGIRPLTGDGAFFADRQDSLEMRVQQDWGPWSVALDVLNAFTWKKYNQEYYYQARYPNEDLDGEFGKNLKPADPQTIRVEVRRRF